MINNSKIIVAISSPIGKGAIGIIRISGIDCLKISVKFLFMKSKNMNITEIESHKLYYASIFDIYNNNEPIDEVMFSYMKAPKTYTGEDTIEIFCHNNIFILNKIINLAIKSGAFLAKPGEFTERAFINGKIDLTKAEAVLSVIHAESSYAEKIAQNQLRGGLSKIIENIRNEVLDNLKDIEVVLDHEGIMDLDYKKLAKNFNNIRKNLTQKIKIGEKTNKFYSGLKIALIGRPNVGKSSLLNSIIDQDKAIVSDVAGTTRDLVEANIEHKGIKLELLDTAGLKNESEFLDNSNDSFEFLHLDIEKKGIEKTKKCIGISDYIIFIIDLSKKIEKQDFDLLDELEYKLKDKIVILVGNKKDKENEFFSNKNYIKDFLFFNKILNTKNKTKNYNKIFQNEKILKVSAKTKENIEYILDFFVNDFLKENIEEQTFMVNSRHKKILDEAIEILDIIINDIENNEELEIIAMDCRKFINVLSEIFGIGLDEEEVLDKIFSNFCIGK